MSMLVASAGLLERNPASHLIWWIAGAAAALLALAAALDLLDDWRGGRRAARGRPGWRLREPGSTLRRRFVRRPRPLRRTWSEGRPAEPDEDR